MSNDPGSFQEDEELYRFLVENTSDGFFIAEVPSGKFLFLNRRICEIFGYLPEEAKDTSIWDVLSAEEHEIVKEKMRAAVKDGKPSSRRSVYAMRRKDKSVFKAEVSLSYAEFRGKNILQGILRDVTEQIYLQEQLRHAQKMEAIGILAGGIAHEFNNLMQAVSGYTELLLLNRNIDDPARQKLEAIRKSTERASELTRQILIFSQKVEKKLQIVKLNHEVMRIHKLLKKTFPKMIDIRLNLDANLRDIQADPALISQVMMNLCINARDAMNESGILFINTANIELEEKYYRNHPELKPGKYVLLSISDTGCGMSREVMRHLFEPFYSTKGRGKGTGLGLAMVYGIMKEHGGHIVCYSEPGVGTTFKIYLPVSQDAESELICKSGIEKSLTGSESILLVDDEEFIRSSGRELLTRFGYAVLTAGDGESALEICREKRGEIDLVILDMLMPGMGGKKCLKELLGIDPLAKIVLASGYSPDGMASEAADIGAKGFIGKPYPVNELLTLIREVLDH